MTTKELFETIKEQSIDFDKENGGVLLIADSGEHTCKVILGKGLNVIAMIMLAMDRDEEFKNLFIKAVEVYKRYKKPSLWKRFLGRFKSSDSE